MKTAKEFKLSAVEAELNGKFWGDYLPLDKLIVESKQCPTCRYFLSYVGKSNSYEYRAYGVCGSCDYARLFWTENQELKRAKKSLMKQAA